MAAALWIAGGPGLGTARADVQVNTYTTGHQENAAVAVAADGDFVVVWQSRGSSGTDASYLSIQGQRYASSGVAVGSQFQVNTYTTLAQLGPSVALDAEGDFVVVWYSPGSAGTDSDGWSVQGQRYASDGSAAGGEFQVNTYTTDFQLYPQVAVAADGDFVVVWDSDASGGTDSSGYSIHGQRYAADGSAAGGEFQVNTYTANGQRFPSVAVDAAGDFVVVWQSFGSGGSDTSRWSIQGQRYASDGTFLGGELQINTYTTEGQFVPSVAQGAGGDFVVVWYSDGSGGTDSSFHSIQGQRYASDGSTVGGQFQINTYTTDGQFNPSVAQGADGDFVVVWDSDGSGGTDSSFYSIQGQRYASDGSAAGGEFQINAYTTLDQDSASVSIDADGNFAVVWESAGSGGTDTDGNSVQMTLSALIFADGFESGDTGAWS